MSVHGTSTGTLWCMLPIKYFHSKKSVFESVVCLGDHKTYHKVEVNLASILFWIYGGVCLFDNNCALFMFYFNQIHFSFTKWTGSLER